MRRVFAFTAIGVAAAIAASPASAATFTVTTNADATTCAPGACSLRGAIIAANAALDADTINLPSGVFTLSLGADEASAAPDPSIGDLDITSPVRIVRTGQGTTVVDGGGKFRVLNVFGATANASLSSLTIRNGRIALDATTPDALYQHGGAGVQVRDDAKLNLDDVAVRDNKAVSTVDGPLHGSQPSGTACETAYGPIQTHQTLYGAGIETFSGTGVVVTIKHSLIQGNLLSDVIGDGNCHRAPRGGGVSIGAGTLTLEDSIVKDNTATVTLAPGNCSGDVTIACPEPANGGTGGGLAVAAGLDPLVVRGSAIVANHVSGPAEGPRGTGGALALSGLDYGATPTNVLFENTTVSGNTSDYLTPGIALTRGNLEFRARFSTFSGNTGAPGAAEIFVPQDFNANGVRAVLESSVVDAAFGCNDGGTVSSTGHSFVAGHCTFTHGPGDTTSPNPGDAKLGLLGGESVPARSPLLGSPLISLGGACVLTTDGRGFPRDAQCDSGAAEFQPGEQANVRPPAITTAPAVSIPLVADPGTWAVRRNSTAFQWQRCDAGGCADIAGANEQSYVPTLDDLGKQFVIVVSATADSNPGSVKSAASARSTPVGAAPVGGVASPTPATPPVVTPPVVTPPVTPHKVPVARAIVIGIVDLCARKTSCKPAVAIKLKTAGAVRLALRNAKGRLVWAKRLVAKVGVTRVLLPVTLRSGAYQLLVQAPGGKARTLRLVVPRTR